MPVSLLHWQLAERTNGRLGVRLPPCVPASLRTCLPVAPRARARARTGTDGEGCLHGCMVAWLVSGRYHILGPGGWGRGHHYRIGCWSPAALAKRSRMSDCPTLMGLVKWTLLRLLPVGCHLGVWGSAGLRARSRSREQGAGGLPEKDRSQGGTAGRRQSVEALPSGSQAPSESARAGRRTRRRGAHFGLDAGSGDVRITRRWRTTDCFHGHG